MKLEAIDPKHPSYICVCTIVRVKGTRLRLHFDGWSESYDFWTSADSPFIFHVGWCEKNCQKLHPPRSKRRARSCAFGVIFSFRQKLEQHSLSYIYRDSFQLKRDWKQIYNPTSLRGPCFTGFQSFVNRKRVNGRMVTSFFWGYSGHRQCLGNDIRSSVQDMASSS